MLEKAILPIRIKSTLLIRCFMNKWVNKSIKILSCHNKHISDVKSIREIDSVKAVLASFCFWNKSHRFSDSKQHEFIHLWFGMGRNPKWVSGGHCQGVSGIAFFLEALGDNPFLHLPTFYRHLPSHGSRFLLSSKLAITSTSASASVSSPMTLLWLFPDTFFFFFQF